jgi:hypothetical protein
MNYFSKRHTAATVWPNFFEALYEHHRVLTPVAKKIRFSQIFSELPSTFATENIFLI